MIEFVLKKCYKKEIKENHIDFQWRGIYINLKSSVRFKKEFLVKACSSLFFFLTIPSHQEVKENEEY